MPFVAAALAIALLSICPRLDRPYLNHFVKVDFVTVQFITYSEKLMIMILFYELR